MAKIAHASNVTSATASQPEKIIRLKNIRTQQQAILQTISSLSKCPVLDHAKIQDLAKKLERTVREIEHLCAQQNASPANLTGPSRQVYTWMKFLTQQRHLQLHLEVTRRANHIAAELFSDKGSFQKSFHPKVFKRVVVEFKNIALLYKSRSNLTDVLIEINEGFICASDEILAAIIKAVLLGKSPTTSQIIKTFYLSEEYSELLLDMDIITEVSSERARGKFYDLEEVFDRVNRDYFAGQMAKPRLSWNRIFTKRKLAHYEPARDRVLVSLTLDDKRVPKFVVEFVMYHELLHKHHGEKWVNDRLVVHTPEFRQDERKFKLYEQVEQWLRKGIVSH